MAGIIERLINLNKEDLAEAFSRLQEECFRKNQPFLEKALEKAGEFSISQELAELAEEKRGTITPILPFRAIKGKTYQIQINLSRKPLVIKELKNSSDFSQALVISPEEAVISWDVSWDNFKLIRVEMGSSEDSWKVEIFGGVSALRWPEVSKNHSLYGSYHFSSLSLEEENFQEKFRRELKKACKNSGWSLVSFADIYPTPFWRGGKF